MILGFARPFERRGDTAGEASLVFPRVRRGERPAFVLVLTFVPCSALAPGVAVLGARASARTETHGALHRCQPLPGHRQVPGQDRGSQSRRVRPRPRAPVATYRVPASNRNRARWKKALTRARSPRARPPPSEYFAGEAVARRASCAPAPRTRGSSGWRASSSACPDANRARSAPARRDARRFPEPRSGASGWHARARTIPPPIANRPLAPSPPPYLAPTRPGSPPPRALATDADRRPPPKFPSTPSPPPRRARPLGVAHRVQRLDDRGAPAAEAAEARIAVGARLGDR